MNLRDIREFQCEVDGLIVEGTVEKVRGDFRDYFVILTIAKDRQDFQKRYAFELRMVNTPPAYKIPVIKESQETGAAKLWSMPMHPAQLIHKVFELGIFRCVELFQGQPESSKES